MISKRVTLLLSSGAALLLVFGALQLKHSKKVGLTNQFTPPGGVAQVPSTESHPDSRLSAQPESVPQEFSKGSNAQGSQPAQSVERLQAVSPSLNQDKTQAQPDACYTVSYRHKKLADHQSEDECSHHRNLIQLPRHLNDIAAVCVRVNGKAVRHQSVEGTDDQLLIGPVAGPHDLITAHFCIGRAKKCHEACDYPKKEIVMRDSFIDAIGGDAEATDENDKSIIEGSAGAWQEADAHMGADVNKAIDPEMRKELQGENKPASVRKPASQAAGNSSLEIFKEWLNQNEKVSCVQHES